MLATEIDLVTLGALITAALTALGTAGAAIWSAVTKLCAYLKPKIDDTFEAHNGLVTEMQSSVPLVRDTLRKLGETQDRQCESLRELHAASTRHEALHAKTGEKLEVILRRLPKDSAAADERESDR